MTEAETAAFRAGQAHSRAMLAGAMLEQFAGDKLAFLKEAMFQPAATAGKTDPAWAAYAEGVRQALNVLKYRGDPAEGYAGIIRNPDKKAFDVRGLTPAVARVSFLTE